MQRVKEHPIVNPAETSGEHMQYLTFQLAGQEYGLDIMQVKEIIEYARLTKVPQTPPFILGVINLRGKVVPVLDLALKFGLIPYSVTPRSCIIIIEVNLAGEPVVAGILVDSVSKVLTLSSDETLPPPAFGTRVGVDFLRGMGRSGDRFVLLLNIVEVLTSGNFPADGAVREL